MKDSPQLVPPTVRARARAATRWPIGFGPRFFVGLLLGLVWLGPGWWDARFLYAMVIWDLLVLGAWLWDLQQLPRPEQLELRRIWASSVALATRSQVELELHNRGPSLVCVAVVDDVPVALRREPPSVELRAAAGRTAEASYAIEPVARGDTRLGQVFLRYRSGLALAERWARAELTQTVRVLPNLEEAKRHTIYLIRSRQLELEKRLKRRRGLGREFESLREYRQGDEGRDICWTASARRAKLIAKVYQVERSQAVWIVLDAGRLLRARVARLTKLDYAVNAALSLAQVALYSGDQVGLLAYGRKPQQRVGTARGTAQLRMLVERLALVRGEASEADHAAAAEMLMAAQKRRSLVVWLTDLAETPTTPEVIESASRMMPRHLVLFAAIGHPELRQLAARRPARASEMYRYVAVQEILHRRELLLRRLRQQGAMAVELEPGRLSTALVNHYLEIKERSLL